MDKPNPFFSTVQQFFFHSKTFQVDDFFSRKNTRIAVQPDNCVENIDIGNI